MKCCDVNPGEFNTRIYIERRTRTADGLGGVTEAWAEDPSGGLMARVRMLTGTERWKTQRRMNGNLYRLTMWFRGDSEGAPYWTTDDRVRIRGRYYNILAVTDIDMERQYISMDVFEGQPS